eukprot:TRINITY_DN3307_c0_g1_i2.p1 TRINITY_DN3307_c0_g1~~TRINITY_DN3307_c0_g1_i2.p1  ORF type:complete len:214 (-),score=55.66 TRINITY_DN3307_c0_g1_i2:107-748(-)
MVSNRCPYIGNEEWCPNPGSVNPYSFLAHFDLMDYNMAGWVNTLSWNNPVVTYRQVPCGNRGSPSCSTASQCQCTTATQCQSGSNTTVSSGSGSHSSTSTSTSTSTSSSTVSTVTSTSASTVSTSSTSSMQASLSGSNSSSGNNNNANHGGSGCLVTILQSIGQTWNGGGLMNVVITNNGTYPINQRKPFKHGLANTKTASITAFALFKLREE